MFERRAAHHGTLPGDCSSAYRLDEPARCTMTFVTFFSRERLMKYPIYITQHGQPRYRGALPDSPEVGVEGDSYGELRSESRVLRFMEMPVFRLGETAVDVRGRRIALALPRLTSARATISVFRAR
ncbi:hypothetical protein GE569_14295 [Burkholderia gladioli]